MKTPNHLMNTPITMMSINQVGVEKTLHDDKLATAKIGVYEPPHFTSGISGASNNVTIAFVTLNDISRTATARSRK